MHHISLWAQIHNWAWQYADVSSYMVMERYKKIEFQVWDLRAQRNPMQKKWGKRSLLEVRPVQQMASEREKKQSNKKEFSGSSMDNVCSLCLWDFHVCVMPSGLGMQVFVFDLEVESLFPTGVDSQVP